MNKQTEDFVGEIAGMVFRRSKQTGKFFTRPADIVAEIGCTWLEASLALELAKHVGYTVGRREDGRFYWGK